MFTTVPNMPTLTTFNGSPGNLLCEPPAPLLDSEQVASSIAEALARIGYAITPHFLSPTELHTLAEEARNLWETGAFRRAKVGQGPSASLQPEIRTDRVCWLDHELATPAQQSLLDRLRELRDAVNQRTFAGLFDWEGHLALYPEGAFYRPHLDRFEERSSRILTTVLYLNTQDVRGAGGELRLWLETPPREWHAPHGETLDIAPEGGTLVTFWSDQLVHEVLPARFERLSITGWFRHRVDDPLRYASMD